MAEMWPVVAPHATWPSDLNSLDVIVAAELDFSRDNHLENTSTTCKKVQRNDIYI